MVLPYGHQLQRVTLAVEVAQRFPRLPFTPFKDPILERFLGRRIVIQEFHTIM